MLEITRSSDPRTDEELYRTEFGENIAITPQLKEKLSGGRPMPPMIGFNALSLISSFKGVVPYRVGEKWSLSVSDNGEVTLVRE